MFKRPLLIPDLPSAEMIEPYLRQIDHNKWYTNFGPLNSEFEKQLLSSGVMPHSLTAAPHITTCSSGTTAIQLLLQSLDLPNNARVLIPSLTFPATALAVIHTGLTPVLTDVDADCWQLTVKTAANCIKKERIDAVIPVCTFGRPIDTKAWSNFSRTFGVPVVIDAASALGSQEVGEGVHAAFSLHATKAFGIGEGGLCASTNSALIEKVKKLSNFGFYGDIVQEIGINAKLSEYHAAVGIAQLQRWESLKSKRRSLANYALTLLDELPVVLQQHHDATIHSVLSILLPSNVPFHRIGPALTKRGIETRQWYCPTLDKHPAFAKLEYIRENNDTISSEELSKRLLGLPFHTHLNEKDMEEIISIIRDIIFEHDHTSE